MKKYLRVKMPDGSVYDIPAEIIANHRANYFENNSAEKLTYHSSSVRPRIYRQEKEFAISNDHILIKWAETRMQWKELEPFAVKVDSDVNYEEAWPRAEKQIICC